MTKRQIVAEKKKQFWENHIKDCKESKLFQAEYCRKHGLKKDAFYYWNKKLSKEPSGISLVSVPIKVNIQPPLKPLVVNINNRFGIEIRGDFEAATLKKVVKTLEGV